MEKKTLRVATRKGLITIEKSAQHDWDITDVAFMGDPVSMVLTDPRNGDRYSALNLGHFGVKLHRISPGGEWQEIAVPKYPKADEAAEDSGPSLEQIWSMAASGADREGTIWAGTIPGGLFKSEDRGDSWQLVESLWNLPEREKWFGGGYDKPGINSVCVDPRDSARVLIAISSGGIWETCDNGATWTVRSHGLRAEYMPPEQAGDPNAQDVHCLALCPANPDIAWIQHHNGIFHSTDSAYNWREITGVKPSVFGFAVAAHPHDHNTAWFVPAVKDECRIPVDGKLVVTRTRDGGKTFEILDKGLPDKHAYDLVLRHALDVDSSGNILAFGSTTGNLWISEDQGENWRNISSTLPPIYTVRFDPEGVPSGS